MKSIIPVWDVREKKTILILNQRTKCEKCINDLRSNEDGRGGIDWSESTNRKFIYLRMQTIFPMRLIVYDVVCVDVVSREACGD